MLKNSSQVAIELLFLSLKILCLEMIFSFNVPYFGALQFENHGELEETFWIEVVDLV